MKSPISSTLRIRPPNNFTVDQHRVPHMTLREWGHIGVIDHNVTAQKVMLELLEANIVQQEIEPTPWYRRAWFKVAGLIGRVPDAWAVLRGRARIETEDW